MIFDLPLCSFAPQLSQMCIIIFLTGMHVDNRSTRTFAKSIKHWKKQKRTSALTISAEDFKGAHLKGPQILEMLLILQSPCRETEPSCHLYWQSGMFWSFNCQSYQIIAINALMHEMRLNAEFVLPVHVSGV